MKKAPYDNHWQKHDGTDYRVGHWSRCFPKFDNCLTRQQAIEQYWEYYYARASKHQHNYPENFKIFDINILNTLQGQVDLLDFAGITQKKQIYDIGIRKNQFDLITW